MAATFVLRLDAKQAAALAIALTGAKLFNEGLKPVDPKHPHVLRMDRSIAARMAVAAQILAAAVGANYAEFCNNEVRYITDGTIDAVIEFLKVPSE